MTLEMLQSAKIAATKARDTATKRVLSDMIDACQKASITSRVELKSLNNWLMKLLSNIKRQSKK